MPSDESFRPRFAAADVQCSSYCVFIIGNIYICETLSRIESRVTNNNNNIDTASQYLVMIIKQCLIFSMDLYIYTITKETDATVQRYPASIISTTFFLQGRI